MNYEIVEKSNKQYIYINSQLSSEEDVLDIIGICMGNNACFLMFNKEALTEDFFNLKTGLAGMALQKFMNYHIKVAAIIEDENKIQGRFRELLVEVNRGNDFRVFKNIEDAETWLLNLK